MDEFELLRSLPPEVTTEMLTGVLVKYRNPQKKIHDLTRQGRLIAVKRGVFLISESMRSRPYSKDVLANLIYGPSYISLESALSDYGLIPERVERVTSVCLGRNKVFETPVGGFDYYRVSKGVYPFGIQLKPVDEKASALYASPEKALFDFLYLREKSESFSISHEYFHYVIDSYRLDLIQIKEIMNPKILSEWSKHYRLKRIHWFVDELIKEVWL